MPNPTRERIVDDLVAFRLINEDAVAMGTQTPDDTNRAIKANDSLIRGLGYTEPQLKDIHFAADNIIRVMRKELEEL